jgi:hypothetical protein
VRRSGAVRALRVEPQPLADHAPLVADQRLRDLERNAAHGDLQAQARLLLERVRVGDLTEERLQLVAYLGHEAARVCISPVDADPPCTLEDLLSVIRLRDTSLLPRAMIEVALRSLEDAQRVPPNTREECERVLAVTKAALRDARPELVWEAARLADQVYNAASVQEDFAARSLATAPAFLADGRIGAESMCRFVSSAAAFLGVPTEDVRRVVVAWLISPGSST